MLFIALIAAYFIVNGAVDITSMITGNQPPSKSYRDAKGENKEDGPLTRAIKAWWADAIEDIDEAKKRRRLESKEEKAAERERRRAERQAWIDDMNQKIEAEKKRQEEEREGRRKTWKWSKGEKAEELPPIVIDEVVEEPAAERPPVEEVEVEEPPTVDETVGEIDPPASEEAGDPIFEADLVVDKTPKAIDPPAEEAEQIDPGPPEGPEIPGLEVIDGGRPDSDEWSVYGKPNLYAVQDVDTQRNAGIGIEAGGTNMTTVAAIEGGISAHIDWTAQMAEYQIRAAAHAEIVGATMFRGDNGPARVAMLRRLQEAHHMLREAYLEVNAVLVNDKRLIGDAYAATGNQAGGKNYTTS
jgi:hypothetical protein